MPLDPKAKGLLDQLAASGARPWEEGSPEEARASLEALFATFGTPEPVDRVSERMIPGPRGDIAIRIYSPKADGPLPGIVFFHGGGWVIGSLETHDAPCRALANRGPAVVVSVAYRLAPEDPYPAPLDDCYAAAAWVSKYAAELGVDPARIAVAGDSAGGNLAAAVALAARDRKGPPIAHQILVYPALDRSFDTESYVENAEGYFLTKSVMVWFWNHYLGERRGDAYACPTLAADLSGLPPATIFTAEFDPLRSEAEAYATRLREAGVTVQLIPYPGMFHGFLGLATFFPEEVGRMVGEAANALR